MVRAESLILIAMEVQFTPEQEARILRIANYNGEFRRRPLFASLIARSH